MHGLKPANNSTEAESGRDWFKFNSTNMMWQKVGESVRGFNVNRAYDTIYAVYEAYLTVSGI